MGVSPDYVMTSMAKMFNQKAKEFYKTPENVQAFKEWFRNKYGKDYEEVIL